MFACGEDGDELLFLKYQAYVYLSNHTNVLVCTVWRECTMYSSCLFIFFFNISFATSKEPVVVFFFLHEIKKSETKILNKRREKSRKAI